MANQEQLELLKQGVEVWNKWRKENPDEKVDLREAYLYGADLRGIDLRRAKLYGADLRKAMLHEAKLAGIGLQKSWLLEADLSRTDLRNADLHEANLQQASLIEANLSGANLSRANLYEVNLRQAKLIKTNLSKSNLTATSLAGADLRGAKLIEAILVQINVANANISSSLVYGASVWDLGGEFRDQRDLIITPEGAPEITVDNIKVAQFVYLILNNAEIRGVLNTLTTKSVLILGRFADPSRKAVLDGLRDKLREFNLLPIVFDFDRPDDKDYTETVQTLAGLSLFVIVDVTSPKSTPLEMEATVKQFKIPFVPIIDISVDERPYAMIVDSQNSFHWVLPTFGYASKEQLLDNIETIIINRALEKHNELRKQKANVQEILTLADLKK